jgi:8-amino-7-oxononanoate synthase
LKPSFLKKLDERLNAQNKRELTIIPTNSIDFFSNDYLGISKDFANLIPSHYIMNGSSGSRLLSGNSKEALDCEHHVATFFKSPASLVFNSGFEANLGLLSCVPQKEDTIIYDEFVHASIRDGIRLSNARSFSFKHNDIESLKQKIKNVNGCVYIVIESVYSMSGAIAPIKEILEVSTTHQAFLIVDEAHAVGIFGSKGEGLCVELGIQDQIFARIVTFSKAYGFMGASILGSKELIQYLINLCRAFIYTTALPTSAYQIISQLINLDIINRKNELFKNISYYNFVFNETEISPIKTLFFPSQEELIQASDLLKEKNIFQKPIFSPTVAIGSERIRLCLHSFNTKNEIDALKLILNQQ